MGVNKCRRVIILRDGNSNISTVYCVKAVPLNGNNDTKDILYTSKYNKLGYIYDV